MESYFHGYSIKYETLDKWMYPLSRTTRIKSINIFISLDDLFHSFHNEPVNGIFQMAGQDAAIQLVSYTINLIAHYRFWAIKHNLSVKVFGIFTSTLRSFKNNVYIPNYRKYFKMKNSMECTSCYFVNTAIQAGIPVIQTIAKYTPGIYIIDSKYLEPSMVPLYIAEDLYKADWNILISKDTYDVQYAFKNKWSMLSPKRNFMSVVDRKGVWNYVAMKDNAFKQSEFEGLHLLYPFELFILAKAVVGDKYRSIPRLKRFGWKTVFKYLDAIMEENKDASITTLKIKFIEMMKKKNITNQELNCNLSSINIDRQKESMLEIDRSLIYSQIVDIPDYDNLQEINRTRFMQYPLNLKFLCNNSKMMQGNPFDEGFV